MSKKFLSFSLLLMCLVTPLSALALPYTNLFVFGDSLSDVGNDLTITGGAVPGPTSDYPFGRFTNGYNYIDGVSTTLFGYNTTSSLQGGSNYAYGGARTNSIVPELVPLGGLSVKQQVDQFVTTLGGGTADDDALYVIWAGANNIQDALRSSTPRDVITAAVADIGSMLIELANAGATQFLVINIPNLGLTPRVTELNNSTVTNAATGLTNLFNLQLNSLLNSLTSLDITRFDAYSLIQQIVANPGAFGFSNVTNRCYTGDDLTWTGGGEVCSDPYAYLFWDGIHPTAHTHQILASYAYQALIPTPTSLALFILGVGLMGMRRAYFGGGNT